MMTIAAWPVVDRDRIVHAFKPGGDPGAEAPFRTLRRHHWVSSGVRVMRRSGAGIAGQLTLFSSLNVTAARLARRGDEAGAERTATLAADLESGDAFAELCRLLSSLGGEDATRVVDGVFPEGVSAEVEPAVRAVAMITERARTTRILPLSPAEAVFAGRIAEVTAGYVKLVGTGSAATLVPRWMAGAAGRDRLGELLLLFTDRLDGFSAVVEAFPGIDVTDESPTADYSPFSREDRRTRTITNLDAQQLAGEPEQLRVVVPVTIEG